MSKYTVQQSSVTTLLSWIKSGQIAIPEMQRPFVWSSTQVRDLLDSLYKGYPIGYLITWQNIDAGLKNGSASGHRQILIDGQQRITAMTTALAKQEVVMKDYSRARIRIAFNPVSEEFATLTPAIRRSSTWIPDVAEFVGATTAFLQITEYLKQNPDVDQQAAVNALQKLSDVVNAPVGIISLADDLDIETVTEIFTRINSKGVPLSSADFAMSKIASHGELGSNLRKLIDYFCSLAASPATYKMIRDHDTEFAATDYLPKIAWMKDQPPVIWTPTYQDVIRVVGLETFQRGRIAPVVSLLSGRDFETRQFDAEIAEESFAKLETGLLSIVNEFTFRQFLMTIESAGFVKENQISSRNALNFAYALYLFLRQHTDLSDGDVKKYVRRWFVMSLLTGRSTGSFETTFEHDMRRIAEEGAETVLDEIERSELSENFWTVTLPLQLNSPSRRTAGFILYQAAPDQATLSRILVAVSDSRSAH